MAKGIIKEINTPIEFSKASKEWNKAEHQSFWKSISPISLGDFCPNSIESFLMSGVTRLASHGEILPYIKIWSYEEHGESLSGCCFSGTKNRMTNTKIFEEVLWQFNGRLANSLKEKKIMLELLNTAESYARRNKFDSLVISRDPRLHKVNRENDFNISNFYTRSGYIPESIKYIKDLRKKA